MIKHTFIIDHDSLEEPNEFGSTDRYFIHYGTTHEYKEITFHILEDTSKEKQGEHELQHFNDILEEPQFLEQLQDDNFQWLVYDRKNHRFKLLESPTIKDKMYHILNNCRLEDDTNPIEFVFYAYLLKIDNTLQDYEDTKIEHSTLVLQFGAGKISDHLNIYKSILPIQ